MSPIYCERMTDPAFWAEPCNALSNLFFMIAAAAAYRAIQRSEGAANRVSYLLVAILFLIGVGSFLWHTFALPWALVADVVPIQVFMLLYAYGFPRYVLGRSVRYALAFLFSFVAFSVLFTSTVDGTLFNGTVAYVPALVFLAVMRLQLGEDPRAGRLSAALSVFMVSMGLRAVDLAVCDRFPVGTHMFWHLLNALCLYLLVRVMAAPTKSAA